MVAGTSGSELAKHILARAANIGELDEALGPLLSKNDMGSLDRAVTVLGDELHYLAQMDVLVTEKLIHAIKQLNQVLAKLYAQKENYHLAYNQLKIQERTSPNSPEKTRIEAEMRQLGEFIRRLEEVKAKVRHIEERVVSNVKQGMSMESVVAKMAESHTN
ncbi:hypothetical protein HZA99_03955 [Candidatus Woesearchaeota archaeon]|nr:hypothetical protein [Candidatus Woesearchaeota archaeon]